MESRQSVKAATCPLLMPTSFTRKLDMLNIDLSTKSNATLSKRSKSHRNRDDDSESSFHFIAYMPISDYAWKFDGLERQPHRLGTNRKPARSKTNVD